MSELQQIGPAAYQVAQRGEMRVPGLLIATQELIDEMDVAKPLEQVRSVACLPGIIGYSIAMPDVHWGYGFPIGGVAAMDVNEGVISPGGVGYDINCGVRIALVPVDYEKVTEKQRDELLAQVFNLVPSGVGRGQKKSRGLSETDYRKIACYGAAWAVEQGFGYKEDLAACESRGVIEGADLSIVSDRAKERGKTQLGSIGSGNHFVEIGVVGKILRPKIAEQWGIDPGQIYVLIHSGSRGFGHQVCTDTLGRFVREGYAEGLPDRQLVAAPIASEAGQDYFAAMAMAANFAFCNRQIILNEVREAFCRVLGVERQSVRLLYDVAHNIAKFEEHEVEGIQRRLCVHRKGATRAFGPGASELAPVLQTSGQPVLVPGDMGRASYILVGQGNALTWCSSCHGAGRARSRIASSKAWRGRNPKDHMKKHGVTVMATSMRTISEEMPDAYKDVERVCDAVEEAGLAKKVAALFPRLVVKG